MAPRTLNLDTGWEWSSSRSSRFVPNESGGWVGSLTAGNFMCSTRSASYISVWLFSFNVLKPSEQVSLCFYTYTPISTCTFYETIIGHSVATDFSYHHDKA